MDLLLDNAPCGYFSFNDEREITAVNQTAATLLEYEKDGLTAKNIDGILSVAGRIFFQTHLFPLVRLQSFAEEIFLTLKTKTGKSLPVVINIQRMHEGGFAVNNCVFICVPNRRKYEDEILEAKRLAEQKVRENSELLRFKDENYNQAREIDRQLHLQQQINEELLQFTKIINHDMQECIRKIIRSTVTIKEKNDLGYLENIAMSAHRLKAINNTLDLFVKLGTESSFFINVDLNAIIHQSLEFVKKETDFTNVQLAFKPLPYLDGLPSQLSILFYQLFSNSIKFRKGESVTISIVHVVVKSNEFKQSKERYLYRDSLKITFKDDGIGFSEEYKEYVFSFMKKLSSGNNEGLGFGLPICKKIVDNHMGGISISSREGEGTTVTIELPLKNENR